MGYSLRIGELRIEQPDPNDYEPGETVDCWMSAHEISHPDAPAFINDQLSANVNARHPSYTAWSEFAKDVGLYDFFFDKQEGLIRNHPGVVKIGPDHLEEIRAAIKRQTAKNPDGIPAFGGWHEDDPTPENADPSLARLLWLEWWTQWALANCEIPVFANS